MQGNDIHGNTPECRDPRCEESPPQYQHAQYTPDRNYMVSPQNPAGYGQGQYPGYMNSPQVNNQYPNYPVPPQSGPYAPGPIDQQTQQGNSGFGNNTSGGGLPPGFLSAAPPPFQPTPALNTDYPLPTASQQPQKIAGITPTVVESTLPANAGNTSKWPSLISAVKTAEGDKSRVPTAALQPTVAVSTPVNPSTSTPTVNAGAYTDRQNK